MPAPVRVAILNDYEIVVAGIAAVLERFPQRIELVEVAAGLPVVSDVDVVLYDSFGQPQADALDVGSIANGTGARVVVFSWNCDDELVREGFGRGMSGCLSKNLTGEELVHAIERVDAGERVRAGGPADEVDGADGGFGRWPGQDVGLSPRESEVLALICQGLTNQDITRHAFIGMNTVKTHIRGLYRKIGATSRSQAVIWGVDHGFVPDRVRHRAG